MHKPKYRLNKKTLKYERIDKGFGYFFIRITTYLFLIGIISGMLIWIQPYIFQTPKEKQLKRKNQQLQGQYRQLRQKISLVENALDELQKKDSNIYRTVFAAEPVNPKINFDTSQVKNHPSWNRSLELMVRRNNQKIKTILNRSYRFSKNYKIIENRFSQDTQKIAHLPAIMPVSDENLSRVACGYGWKIHPIYKIKKFHHGIDFSAAEGTEVYATGDGKVISIKKSKREYGNRIIIQHDKNYKTLYAHLKDFAVRYGETVERGDIIGYVGNTGTSVAPHLHYEVIKNGEKINPVHFFFGDLTPKEYKKVIVISSRIGQSFD